MPPSAAGFHPMPAFCVQPNRSPDGRSRSISRRQRQRARRPARRAWTHRTVEDRQSRTGFIWVRLQWYRLLAASAPHGPLAPEEISMIRPLARLATSCCTRAHRLFISGRRPGRRHQIRADVRHVQQRRAGFRHPHRHPCRPLRGRQPRQGRRPPDASSTGCGKTRRLREDSGKNLLFLATLAILMVPYATLLIPLYVLLQRHRPAELTGRAGAGAHHVPAALRHLHDADLLPVGAPRARGVGSTSTVAARSRPLLRVLAPRGEARA